MTNRTIAHYRITAKIGQGGMGEVFRAKDTKLDREVAIKVLPRSFAKDRDRISRFNREAKALAALNHPHIAGIYGLEQSGDVHAIAMELVEGEDLSQRLKRGPLKVEDALEVCKQIAEALEAAHEKGIVHRDLKPGNVMLTHQGKVKVLDFGLAKAAETSKVPENDPVLPTITADVTAPGTVIGTTAYMSPEQARGEEVDKRSDIWSFGVLMLECLTGERIFYGKTAADTVGAVLHKPVDWKSLPRDTPPTVHLLLRKCLAKDRQRRLPDISAARIDLEEAIADPNSTFLRLNDESRKTSSAAIRFIMVAAGVALTCLATALGWFLKSTLEAQTAPAQPIRQLNVELRLAGRLMLNKGTAIQISPDGSTLAFLAVPDDGLGQPQLYLKRLNQLAGITTLSIAEGTSVFGFSPDSQWLVFHNPVENALQKVLLTGGSSITLCEATPNQGLDWSDDWIVFHSSEGDGLLRVSASGGICEPLTIARESGMTHAWPQVLPGSKAVLYTAHTEGNAFDEATIMVQRLEAGRSVGQPEVVWKGGYRARFLPTGHLVYVNQGSLFAAAFDLRSYELEAPPVSVIEELATNRNGGAPYDVTPNGTLVYVRGSLNHEPLYNLEWLDRNGIRSPFPLLKGAFGWFQLSPDGRLLAYDLNDGEQSDIWLYDLEQGNHTKLTFDRASEYRPVWSPNGESVAFALDREGVGNLYWKRADGTGETQRLTESPNSQFPWSWHPDGRHIAIYEGTVEGGADLRIVELEGDDTLGWKAVRTADFEATKFAEVTGSFSPDGNWLAFASNELGQFQVFVRPFRKSGGKKQVSIGSGLGRASYLPGWSSAVHELIFANMTTGHKTGECQIFTAEYSASEESLNLGATTPWKVGRFFQKANFKSFDVHPDGKRLLVRKLAEGSEEQIFDHVVLFDNFSNYLNEKVPNVRE